MEDFNELINTLKEQCESDFFREALFKRSAIEKLLNGIEELKEKAEHPSNIEYLIDYITNIYCDIVDDHEHLNIRIRLPKGFKFGVSLDDTLADCLKKPYQKPKIKLSQFEYDSLSCCNEVKRKKKFSYFTMLKQMKYKGYYKGVYDVSMTVQEILDNCEVINEAI